MARHLPNRRIVVCTYRWRPQGHVQLPTSADSIPSRLRRLFGQLGPQRGITGHDAGRFGAQSLGRPRLRRLDI